MKIVSSVTTLLFVLISLTVSAQDFREKLIPPTEGKSVIYFVRSSDEGTLMNIRYFDDKNYIGKFNGRSYFRYECNPGEHIFWIKAENIAILKANLEEGKVYMMETNPEPGAITVSANFYFIDLRKERVIQRMNKVFSKRKETTFTEEELKDGQYKNRFVIERGFKKVQKKLKKRRYLVLRPSIYVKLD